MSPQVFSLESASDTVREAQLFWDAGHQDKAFKLALLALHEMIMWLAAKERTDLA